MGEQQPRIELAVVSPTKEEAFRRVYGYGCKCKSGTNKMKQEFAAKTDSSRPDTKQEGSSSTERKIDNKN